LALPEITVNIYFKHYFPEEGRQGKKKFERLFEISLAVKIHTVVFCVLQSGRKVRRNILSEDGDSIFLRNVGIRLPDQHT
jgi:hypothetical protein